MNRSQVSKYAYTRTTGPDARERLGALRTDWERLHDPKMLRSLQLTYMARASGVDTLTPIEALHKFADLVRADMVDELCQSDRCLEEEWYRDRAAEADPLNLFVTCAP